MNKDEFLKIIDIVRGMKSKVVNIYPDKIIGSDDDEGSYSLISEVICDTKATRKYRIHADILKYINSMDNIDNYNEALSNLSISSGYVGIDILEQRYITALNMTTRHESDYIVADLKENNDFNEIIAKKAKYGASLLALNNKYVLSIYKGLVPVNKSDKLSLELFDINDTMFIARFAVNKRKFIINKYVQYLFI